jgi:hypothetical protein
VWPKEAESNLSLNQTAGHKAQVCHTIHQMFYLGDSLW